MTINLDKESRYRSAVNVVSRPAQRGEGLELIGHHEILIPLLHAAMAGQLALAPKVVTPDEPRILETPNLQQPAHEVLTVRAA